MAYSLFEVKMCVCKRDGVRKIQELLKDILLFVVDDPVILNADVV